MNRDPSHDRRTNRSALVAALAWGFGIGLLAGLIGLGGAEFRLPVLMVLFALAAHVAVRFNLLISLATLVVAAFARFGYSSFGDLESYVIPIAALMIGGAASAWYGAGLLARLSRRHLTAIIATLLLLITGLLVAEVATRQDLTAQIPDDPSLRALVGVTLGLGIGLVSSLLGVAGGELLIPTLLFLFGADVRTAGTASVLISIPIVIVGVTRHARTGAYSDQALLTRLVLPMAAGSAAGAIAGAALLPITPTAALKTILAVVLAVSAVRLLR